jgi:hypothetical protein
LTPEGTGVVIVRGRWRTPDASLEGHDRSANLTFEGMIVQVKRLYLQILAKFNIVFKRFDLYSVH